MNQREMRFKAWDKEKECWVTDQERWYVTQEGEIAFWHDGKIMVDEDVIPVMSTGLHDKNGKEIYEGDIVSGQMCYADDDGRTTEPEEAVGEVRFGEFMGTTAFWITHGINFKEFPLEVIGNIHENPDLLK